MHIRFSLLLGVAVFVASCTTSRTFESKTYTNEDRALADSMLAHALDHEAIYSLLDTLKPISSVHLIRVAVAKDSSDSDGDNLVVNNDSLLKKVAQYQRICRSLSRGDWQFIMTPFKMIEKNNRSLEIYVVRKSRMASILRQYSAFFGQWGFTPAADPAVVLSVVEYESPYDRFRAYGYLFGYPAYAVDFFVTASKNDDVTKKLTPRSFFAIPVFVGAKGYFTYAMPKTHQPGAEDSTLYRQATNTLEKYKAVRAKYQTATGLSAVKLWEDWNKL